MNLLKVDATSLLLNELRNKRRQTEQHIRYIYEYINSLDLTTSKTLKDIKRRTENEIEHQTSPIERKYNICIDYLNQRYNENIHNTIKIIQFLQNNSEN